MGDKGKITFIYADESGDVQSGATDVYLCEAGSTPGGASATQMLDSDSNGTYIVDLEDSSISSGLYDIYADGVLEIEDYVVINKDLIDNVTAHGASITDHESSITTLETNLDSATGDIDSLQGSVASMVSDIASLTSSLSAHEADSSDPHGATLNQSRLVCSDIRGASGDSEIKIQGKDGVSPITFIVENYGSPSGQTANFEIQKGDLRFGDNTTRFYKSGTYDFVLDINRSGANSKFQVINSDASKSSKLVVDGGISADVDEVVSARGGYQDLDTRLDNMDSATNVIAHVFQNMNELQGFNETGNVVANYIHLHLITVPHKLSINRIRVYCASACGAGETFDFGMYDSNGDRVLSVGGTVVNSTGIKNLGVGSSYLLNPDEYYLAITGTTGNGSFRGYQPDLDMHQRWGYLTGGGATLPAKITPSDITTDKRFIPYMVLDSENF